MTIEELRDALTTSTLGYVQLTAVQARALLAALDVSEAVGQWNDAQDPFAGKPIADAYDAFNAALQGKE